MTNPAIDRAERAITHNAHAAFKDRVRYALRHPEAQSVQIRYGARMAFLQSLPVSAAVVRVRHWIALEQRSYRIACSFGRGNRLGLMVLGELLLALRWMRLRGVTMMERAA